jgi:hypothetical protein
VTLSPELPQPAARGAEPAFASLLAAALVLGAEEKVEEAPAAPEGMQASAPAERPSRRRPWWSCRPPFRRSSRRGVLPDAAPVAAPAARAAPSDAPPPPTMPVTPEAGGAPLADGPAPAGDAPSRLASPGAGPPVPQTAAPAPQVRATPDLQTAAPQPETPAAALAARTRRLPP